MLQVGFLPAIGRFMAQFPANETFVRKFGLLLVVCTGKSASRTALAQFCFFGALVLVARPWIMHVLLLACIL